MSYNLVENGKLKNIAGGGGSDIEQFIGTTEEWNDLSDAEKDRYLNKEVILTDDGSGGSGAPEVYSIEEVKTNKVWIDGKPIYRKVIFGSYSNNDVLLTNVEMLVKCYGIAVNPNNKDKLPIPFGTPSMYCSAIMAQNSDSVKLYTNYSKTEYNITLEYTKKD